MKKNIFKYISCLLAVLLIIPTAFLFAGCDNNEKIEIKSYFKTEYFVGETLDVSNGKLNYTKGSTTTEVMITPDMISGFSTETAGTKILTLTYNDLTIKITYIVKVLPPSASFQNVYKSTTTVEAEDFYFYLKFINKTTLSFTTSNAEDLKNYNSSYWNGKETYTFEQSIVDSKITYSWSVEAGKTATMEFVATVNTQNNISLNIYENNTLKTQLELFKV